MPSNTPPRRCTECGEPQHITSTTTDYPESGLDNVQLINVPIWLCSNGHQELQIPAAEQLHALLINMVIRKPIILTGSEVRFLRKELGMSGKAFAEQLGMSPEHLSLMETGKRAIQPSTNLLVRLAVAWELTRRQQIEFPADLEPFVVALEAAWDVGSHRLQHLDNAPPPDRQWEEAPA